MLRHLEEEQKQYNIFPDKQDIFKAFQMTSPDKIKVVILGQDPYPAPGDVMGLAFSVKPNQKLPRSLKNIFKELANEIDMPMRTDGDLSDWAKQGVFLLNTHLTVREKQVGSHRKLGWERLTDAVIQYLNQLEQPIVFLLWGNDAQTKQTLLDNPKHLVLVSAHPSPLSARLGFFGCDHFIQANEFLVQHGIAPIKWC